MTYSEAHFERMEGDPVLTRAYFWRVAQNLLVHGTTRHERMTGRIILEDLEAITKATVASAERLKEE